MVVSLDRLAPLKSHFVLDISLLIEQVMATGGVDAMEVDVPQPSTTITTTTDQSVDATKAPIVLKKWNGVVLWGYDIEVDICAICRNKVVETCIDCQANSFIGPTETCNIAWGECNHVSDNH